MTRTRPPIEVVIEVDPLLGKVRVRATRHRGADKVLLRSFLRTVEHAAHLYSLKERIQKGYRLSDCAHTRTRRAKGGVFCSRCGWKVRARVLKARNQQVREIRKRLASAPVVRRQNPFWQELRRP